MMKVTDDRLLNKECNYTRIVDTNVMAMMMMQRYDIVMIMMILWQ